MPFSTILKFVFPVVISGTLLAGTLPDSLQESKTGRQNDHPVLPGKYGQKEVLQKSKLNLGKGAPYVMISEPQQQTNNQPNQQLNNQSNTQGFKPLTQPGYSPLIFAKPMPIQSPPMQKGPETMRENRPADISENISANIPSSMPSNMRATSNFMFNSEQQPEDLPPPPNEYIAPEHEYPDARQLDEQFQNAKNLPFDQWGQQPAQAPADPINFQAAPDPSAYDYPRPNRYYQGNQFFQKNGQSNFMSSYPALNPTYAQRPYAKQAYDPYLNEAHLNDPWPNNLSDNLSGRPFTPPANMDLQHFDQFPVPQDLYGNAPISPQTSSGKGDFFKKIPEEEIIYPPNYPGVR